jgi:hypothetical protein
MEENQVLDKWNELKTLVANIEPDVSKNARGVAAAGVRARKGLRDVKNKAAVLVKMMVAIDKAAKAERPKKERKTKKS